MQALRVEFFGGPRDGAEIPARYLVTWSVGAKFEVLGELYQFDELPDGRRIARFLGESSNSRST